MGFKDWITEKLQRKVYSYELQECGRASKGGWATIATMDKFEKPVALAEHFKPGFMYRLMARDLEKGTYAKVKWKHFEPSLEIEKVEKEKVERAPARMPTPAEIMTMWADSLQKQMEPVFTFGKVMKSLRESFNDAFGGTGGEGGTGIPAPQFEGKLPAIMHPYVIKEVGETVKGVTDHFFSKLDEFKKKAFMPPQEPEQSAVEFPTIEEYMAPPEPEAEKVSPREQVEATPTEAPAEEEKEAVPEEKPEEEQVPKEKKRRKKRDGQGSD